VDSICRLIVPKPNRTITRWKQHLETTYRVSRLKVLVPRLGDFICPFAEFAEDNGSPEWWKNYNSIKHNRGEEFHKANLITALNMLGGLLILNIIHLQRIFDYLEGNEGTFPPPFDNGLMGEVQLLFDFYCTPFTRTSVTVSDRMVSIKVPPP
jgi:hypothetical protein